MLWSFPFWKILSTTLQLSTWYSGQSSGLLTLWSDHLSHIWKFSFYLLMNHINKISNWLLRTFKRWYFLKENNYMEINYTKSLINLPPVSLMKMKTLRERRVNVNFQIGWNWRKLKLMFWTFSVLNESTFSKLNKTHQQF